ncbi:hypothetical protein Trydic_g11811 [Trypoxylus dichotomus]
MLEPCNYQPTEVPHNQLLCWEHLQYSKQHFWNRWPSEYLHNLQARSKCINDQPNLQVGDFLILIEDHIPPLRWPSEPVTGIQPGSDGVVRGASVRMVLITSTRCNG